MIILHLDKVDLQTLEFRNAGTGQLFVKQAHQKVGLHELEGATEPGELRNLLCAEEHHKVLEVILLPWFERGLPWARVVQGFVGPESTHSKVLKHSLVLTR